MATKRKAEAIFDEMGISMSGAMNMFLAQVVRDKGMPFLPSTIKKDGTTTTKKEADPNAGFIALEELWDEL